MTSVATSPTQSCASSPRRTDPATTRPSSSATAAPPVPKTSSAINSDWSDSARSAWPSTPPTNASANFAIRTRRPSWEPCRSTRRPAMGMRILAGRALAGGDAPSGKAATPAKVVVNQVFVRRFFPNVNPIGQRFGVGVKPVEAADDEIVGVVSDAKYRSLREPIVPTFYNVATEYYGFVLNVRTRVRPESIFRAVQKVLASIDPSAAFLEIHTLAEEVDDTPPAERLTAVLVSVLGAIAVLLSGVGIYGLLAYAIVQRRREIGIRMALGAEPAHIARLVGRETLAMAVGGIVCGLAAALAAGPWIRSLLYGISPWDLKSLSAAAIFVAIVAVGATAIPVIRATHIEPDRKST